MQEGERLAGAPIVFSDAPYVFDEEDRLMFIQVGKQLGQALVNTRIHEKVRVEAITDGLTGAYNRRYLDDFLNIEVKRSQRYQRPMSILLLDMDYFHACNEKAGHQAGDRALRDVVQLLNLGVRSVDLVARYGGEEFMVVLPETEAGRRHGSGPTYPPPDRKSSLPLRCFNRQHWELLPAHSAKMIHPARMI